MLMRLNQKKKKKKNEDFGTRPTLHWKREARDGVRKQIDRYFTTKKTRETSDENFSTFCKCHYQYNGSAYQLFRTSRQTIIR